MLKFDRWQNKGGADWLEFKSLVPGKYRRSIDAAYLFSPDSRLWVEYGVSETSIKQVSTQNWNDIAYVSNVEW